MEKTIFGLSIYTDGPNDTNLTLTGFPNKQIGHDYEDAYEFEAAIKKHISWVNTDPNIEFDSEYCQFFVYVKDRATLDRLITDIEAHYVSAKAKRDEVASMY